MRTHRPSQDEDAGRPHAEAQAFREAMAHLAAPVSVVTALDPAGRRRGFTATSVTSVSLDPPMVLVGVGHRSSCHAALTGAREFTVNVLGAEHDELARRFAAHGIDRFAGTGFAAWPGTGAPYLPGAKVLLRCRTADVVRAGDHDLVLGTVTDAHTGDPAQAPLLWYRRAFHTPAPALPAAAA
ncbi:flavin reductase family protein [Streptomyces sp. AC602_WCS936]|uniref:flavin reductase family protein n=1 Tax=Streptomyces sp. AC602_WCS936 TaxID=2823685 RepID=UPI0027E41932|nr:flavin reductase family protein [Streptomyces sp. AC602_WCS936]